MALLNFFRQKFTRKAFRRKSDFSLSVLPVKVKNKRAWEQDEYFAHGDLISEKGLHLVSNAPTEVGDRVLLKFALRTGSKIVEVEAVVRNVRTVEDGKKGAGVEFFKPSPEVVHYLSTILMLYKA